MQESIATTPNNSVVIDFAVEPTSVKRGGQQPTATLDLDLQSTETILKDAELCFERKDFKTTAKLVERALPAIDRLYCDDEAGKLRALRILRDSYLALSKGVEAKDCAEVGLSVFEEIMRAKLRSDVSPAIGDPSAFARPVVRKLKTLRRSKDSEFLRKRSVDISEKWRTFCKTP